MKKLLSKISSSRRFVKNWIRIIGLWLSAALLGAPVLCGLLAKEGDVLRWPYEKLDGTIIWLKWRRRKGGWQRP